MKPKEHKINTVQDIINATNEDNLDNFLKDLKGIIMTAHHFERVTGETVQTDGFIWIDDEKHFIDIKIEPK